VFLHIDLNVDFEIENREGMYRGNMDFELQTCVLMDEILDI
jgi:hypothetical protein